MVNFGPAYDGFITLVVLAALYVVVRYAYERVARFMAWRSGTAATIKGDTNILIQQESRRVVFKAGHIFDNGKGGGYKLTRDLCVGDPLLATSFEAFGGERPVRVGEKPPQWLKPQIYYREMG